MQAQEVVGRYFEAWNKHDPQAIMECLAPNGTYTSPAVPEGLNGIALSIFTTAFFHSFSDVSFQLLKVIANGNLAAVEWVMTATNDGGFQGEPATGNTVKVPGTEILELENGKVRSARTYYDRYGMVAQLSR
jgi:steroid delta-isomerase-like uncharacterized protein